VSANAARQDSDRDFLIIAEHPLNREIITKLKDGLYDIELKNSPPSLFNNHHIHELLFQGQVFFQFNAVGRTCEQVGYGYAE